MTADDELHEHYNELLHNADSLIYGRITYQLMEDYWPTLIKDPSGNQPMDDFAVLIDNIPKIVYSRTLKNVTWNNSILKREIIREEILDLKHSSNNGKNIFVGSPSMIVALTKLDLIDEYQLCVHPVVVGSGLTLFKDISKSFNLKLFQTKTLGSGAITLYYKRVL